jgi:hypothetical protein
LRRLHWHIDYLRPAVSLQEIWFTTDPVPREHLWAEMIAGLPGAGTPIPRFGASDCRCRSHLFHFASKPSFSVYRRLISRREPGHGPIQTFLRSRLVNSAKMGYSVFEKIFSTARRKRR